MGKYNQLFWVDTKFFDLASIVIKLMRLPYYLKNKKKVRDNKGILSSKTCDTCYILGLGPSLKKVNLGKLDGDIITVNSFCRLNQKSIKPNIYCIMDSIDYVSDESTIVRDATSMYPDAFFVFNGKFMHEAEKRICGNVKRAYLFSWGGYFKPESKVDICRIMPIMGNIVCYAIYLAMYMKYKKIVLLGCDFNSFTSRKDLHCYKDDSDNKLPLSYELFCYSFCADTHYRLYEYAKRNGIEIINATDGSLLDAYPTDEQ